MKYKVGDKVRVRKDLQVSDYFGKTASNSMTAHAGREVTIRSFYGNRFEQYYTIEEDDGEYKWAEAMFEGFEKNETVDEQSSNNSGSDAIKPDYYERSAMQPLEVMQRIMTAEQFEGFLLGNCIKYRMRCENKGQRDSDMHKARQYAYWLEMTKEGRIINPSEDKVPDSYKFKVV
jgi:hypothetical protein